MRLIFPMLALAEVLIPAIFGNLISIYLQFLEVLSSNRACMQLASYLFMNSSTNCDFFCSSASLSLLSGGTDGSLVFRI